MRSKLIISGKCLLPYNLADTLLVQVNNYCHCLKINREVRLARVQFMQLKRPSGLSANYVLAIRIVKIWICIQQKQIISVIIFYEVQNLKKSPDRSRLDFMFNSNLFSELSLLRYVDPTDRRKIGIDFFFTRKFTFGVSSRLEEIEKAKHFFYLINTYNI